MTKELIELSKIPCLCESNASWIENVVYITIDDKTVLEFRIGDTTVRMTSDGLLKLIIDNGGEVVVNG